MTNGLCQHNNLSGYCPSCLKGSNMRKSMGAYELVKGSGIFIPDLGELTKGASAGALSSTAQTLATSAGVKSAAIDAAGNSLGTKIVKFYKEQPVMAYGATALVAILLFAGVRSYAK